MKTFLTVIGLIAAIAIIASFFVDPVPAYADGWGTGTSAPESGLNALETIQNCKNYMGQWESRRENINKVAASVGLYNTVRVYENCNLVSVKIDPDFQVESWRKTQPVIGNEDQKVHVLSVTHK